MGVDSFWKRVPEEAITGFGPEELRALVPHWFDDRFKIEQDQGILVGGEDTGALINALVRLGVTTEFAATAAAVFTGAPPDWDDDWMVGRLPPDAVRQVAEFFAGAPLDRWAEENFAGLAAEAQRLGYHRPFDRSWASRVLSDAHGVAVLFRTAAANNEAVIVKVSV
jgi:hypothetical protein